MCIVQKMVQLPFCSKSDNFELFSHSCLDPLDPLELRVDHQWPALSVCEDGGVLNGHPVTGKVLVAPLSYLGCIGEEREDIQVLCHWNSRLHREKRAP